MNGGIFHFAIHCKECNHKTKYKYAIGILFKGAIISYNDFNSVECLLLRTLFRYTI